MIFRTWLSILICLILFLAGCIKPPIPPRLLDAPPPAPPPKVERAEIYDPELPEPYRELVRRTPIPAAETVPLAFLAAADDCAAKGETARAFRFIDKAAEGFARNGTRSGEAAALSRRASLLADLGREKEAGDEILRAREKWPDPPLSAFAAFLAGHVALLKGDGAAAGEALSVSLKDNPDDRGDPFLVKLRRDTQLDAGIAALLAARPAGSISAPASSGTADNAPEAGQEQLRAALALNQELSLSRIALLIPAADFLKTEAEAVNFLGLGAGLTGDRAEAFRHLVRSGELSRTAGFTGGRIRSLLFRAELGLGGEPLPEGRQAAEELRELADRRGASPYRIWARSLLARYAQKGGSRQEAISYLREAAGIIGTLRSRPKPEMIGKFSPAAGREIHESLVGLLAAEGMAGEALKAAEAAKSIAMVEMLSGQEIGRTPAEDDHLLQETLLAAEIGELQRLILLISDERIAGATAGRLRAVEEAYRALRVRISDENPRLSPLIAASDVDPAALRLLLDGNTTLFDYFATPGALYVWAVHREQLHLEKIDVTRDELRAVVFSLLAAIRDKDKRKIDLLSRKAYDLLLKPIIPFVSGERIGFIPDDALSYLPFAALRYRGKILAEGFSLFHLSGAGLLQQLLGEARTPGLRILAFGNPDLEDETLDLNRAPQELERIRRRIGGTRVLFGAEATEGRAEDLLSGYDILHFAVRGQFFPDDVLNSGLLLTPDGGDDGRLTLREIFRLKFDGRAVILSGCDPQPQRDPEGRGFTALQRAFLTMGSPSVVSTLWFDEDKAVYRLLDFFYRRLEKKDSVADALRAAQLQLFREGQPPHVWAAFILTGRY